MAANAGAVDHVLPVVGQTQIDQCLQQGIPDTLFGPATEAHIDGVPLVVSLVHVAPGTADPQHVKHSIEEEPAIARGSRPTTALRRQQRPDQAPLRIRQIPATHDGSSKSSIESEQSGFGNPFCQHGLALLWQKIDFMGGDAISALRGQQGWRPGQVVKDGLADCR